MIEASDGGEDATMEEIVVMARMRVGGKDASGGRRDAKAKLILRERKKALSVRRREFIHSAVQRQLPRSLL